MAAAVAFVDRVVAELDAAQTREQAVRALRGLSRADLLTVADYLNVEVGSRLDTKVAISRRLVGATVGARLDAAPGSAVEPDGDAAAVAAAAGAERAGFCAALRELAEFLQAHPALPLPSSAVVGPFIDRGDGDDESERAEVDRIAGILGVEPIARAEGDHYVAARRFGDAGRTGGITYSAVAITAAHMARYEALTSYDGVVTP